MSDSGEQDKTRIQLRKKVRQLDGADPPPMTRPPNISPDDVKKTTKFEATKVKKPVADAAQRTKAQQRKRQQPQQGDLTVSLGGGQAGASSSNTKNLQARDVLKGRFILERVIGAGGMGVVYKAKDLLKVEAKDRDPYVAIKVLGEEFKSHPEAFIALQRESRKTQRIAHPNIVNVHDFDKDGDTVFMTMEYLEGTPLDKLIKKYRSTGLPENDIWQILNGVCAALAYAHEQNIIHSDLKPGNIFVTNVNLAKVFDFGIARAVARAEQGEVSEGDKTVFDAGNLGALTPAYASLEMLEGDPPDVRDDLYALGCIAYELFTGEHPFKRKNAKDAKRLGLKPARIDGISRQQWRAIEQSLAFERADRLGSVQEFWDLLTKKKSRPYLLWTTFILIVVVSGILLSDLYYRPDPVPQVAPDTDYLLEMEQKVRLDIIEQELKSLLKNPVFDSQWEANIRQRLQELIALVGEDHPRVAAVTTEIYQLYVKQIRQEVTVKDYDNALLHVENGRPYTVDQTVFDELLAEIESALAAEQKIKQDEEEKRRLEEQQMAAERQKEQEEARKRSEFQQALNNINEQLKCETLLDMQDFSIAVKKLRNLNYRLYQKEESSIVGGLAGCIHELSRNFPERAQAALDDAMSLFKDNRTLSAIKIEKRDACSQSLAGLGSRGRRTLCQDVLSVGIKGPSLVVIPPLKGSGKAFAIGKYEVSIEEFNQYCQATRNCDMLTGGNTSLPKTDVALETVRNYTQWLSQQTGRVYRLPTLEEWSHASIAKGRGLDPNRNCFLDSRGLQKGGALISVAIGQQNGWGVVNYVGNALEWVTSGNRLFAVGGSYRTDMQECDVNWRRASTGKADTEIGFRVARELGD